ncbi:hypothetical protein AB0425_15540 [Actinosynnema sp. NPDC051121]
MTRSDQPGRRSPRRRAESTKPSPTRPGGRRGADRRPWPTAPTTTRVSPTKPSADTAPQRSRGSSSTPTPATVWTTATTPTAPDATWPAAVVERVVTSFSEPGAHVVLLVWPTPNTDRPQLTPNGRDGVIDHAPGTEPDAELADAVHAVKRLGRTARVERIPVDQATTGPASRPFWADLVGGTASAPVTLPYPPAVAAGSSATDAVTPVFDRADLVVTSARPQHCGGHGADLVALVAARLLRVGGILTTLTHCDWSTGELTDPTGPMVAAAQNADLLYLQHIVAVHAPIRNGRFHLSETHVDGGPDDGGPSDIDARTVHRALVRGLPPPHRRIHSDVLVFAQPHDHRMALSAPTDPSSDRGGIR